MFSEVTKEYQIFANLLQKLFKMMWKSITAMAAAFRRQISESVRALPRFPRDP